MFSTGFQNSLRIALLVIACVALSGCGHYSGQLSSTYKQYDFAPDASPLYPKPMSFSDNDAPPSGDDPLANQPDPMSGTPGPGGSDPLLGGASSGGDTSAKDPMIQKSDPMTDSSDDQSSIRGFSGRYWMHGSVALGTLDILVNGTSIGSFQNQVDLEITRFCRAGSNTVTFIHHTNGTNLCSVHISVWNILTFQGTPPVLTYDTTAIVEAGSSSTTDPFASGTGTATGAAGTTSGSVTLNGGQSTNITTETQTFVIPVNSSPSDIQPSNTSN